MFCGCRHYSVAEVISILDEEFQSADTFILPPEDPTSSDEDSGPEDDDGNIDNLTGNQLRAEAEASVTIVGFDKKHLGTTKEYVKKHTSLKLIVRTM